eukprot:TRINITY_DN7518_c0_g1_i1.p1 TRINITY_DN7518_c0_g1~~TRINITY_DN7518_c0_g1_i1.p1  ORF type:complete len:246 (+),score=41.58 TRINITY_DN7518_c0_g1_i1:152-889(+)
MSERGVRETRASRAAAAVASVIKKEEHKLRVKRPRRWDKKWVKVGHLQLLRWTPEPRRKALTKQKRDESGLESSRHAPPQNAPVTRSHTNSFKKAAYKRPRSDSSGAPEDKEEENPAPATETIPTTTTTATTATTSSKTNIVVRIKQHKSPANAEALGVSTSSGDVDIDGDGDSSAMDVSDVSAVMDVAEVSAASSQVGEIAPTSGPEVPVAPASSIVATTINDTDATAKDTATPLDVSETPVVP